MNAAAQNPKSKGWLYWIPRILGVGYSAFISLFALDIFAMDLPFWELLLGLFMHLIPSFVVLGALILSWRFELAGGMVFILLGLLFPVVFRGASGQVWFFMIAPLWLIGLLFIMNDRKRKASG